MPADLTERADFDDANRGLVAPLEPGVVKSADGRVVYDADMFTQTTAEDPRSAAPEPWGWRNSPVEGEVAR